MATGMTLDELRDEYAQNRFLPMPIAGTIAWAVSGILGAVLPVDLASWALFICTGGIFWLGAGIGRLMGEDLIGERAKKSELDNLFLLNIFMACLAWGIVIPFFMIDKTSLPLGAGILAGMMWLPFSWMIRHWVGLFHGISRTVLVVAAWYLFPEQRFVAIPAVIVAIYLVTIVVLATRKLPEPKAMPTRA